VREIALGGKLFTGADFAVADPFGEPVQNVLEQPAPLNGFASALEIAGCGTVHTMRLWQSC